MSKHKNPLEKEFLIRQYKSNPSIKMSEFCQRNDMSATAFMKWIKQYEEGGLEGLARAVMISVSAWKDMWTSIIIIGRALLLVMILQITIERGITRERFREKIHLKTECFLINLNSFRNGFRRRR